MDMYRNNEVYLGLPISMLFVCFSCVYLLDYLKLEELGTLSHFSPLFFLRLHCMKQIFDRFHWRNILKLVVPFITNKWVLSGQSLNQLTWVVKIQIILLSYVMRWDTPTPPPPFFFPSPSFDEKLIGEINFHTLNNIRLFKRVTQFSYFVLVAKDASQLQGMLQNFSRNSLAALLTIRKSYWILIVPSTDCENLLRV